MTNIQTLPPEVFDLICFLVAGNDANLAALSRVNRHCRHGTARHRFNTIVLPIQKHNNGMLIPRRGYGGHNLEEAVREADQILSRGNYHYVRHLDVNRGLTRLGKIGTRTASERQVKTEPHFFDINFDIVNPTRYLPKDKSGWMPLLSFIQRLTALRDFTWSIATALPPDVSELLTRVHPQARLHVRKLVPEIRWPTKENRIGNEAGIPPQILPHMDSLAQSVALRSIPLHSIGLVAQSKSDHDDIFELITTATPNLRHATVVESRRTPPRSGYTPRNRNYSSSPPNTKVSLESFALIHRINLPMLLKWRNCINFSNLRSFQFQTVYRDVLETLLEMTRDGEFRSLHTLNVKLPSLSRNLDDMVDLLSLLPPLRHLHIDKPDELLLNPNLLKYHGPTLESLSVGETESAVLSREQVELITSHCRNLSHIRLGVSRSKGSADGEVAIYRLLGRTLPRLETAHLMLYCSTFWAQSDGDVQDHAGNADRMRDALINCAVDQALSRAIFNTIARAQQESSSGSSNTDICPPFRHLTLDTRVYFPPPAVDEETSRHQLTSAQAIETLVSRLDQTAQPTSGSLQGDPRSKFNILLTRMARSWWCTRTSLCGPLAVQMPREWSLKRNHPPPTETEMREMDDLRGMGFGDCPDAAEFDRFFAMTAMTDIPLLKEAWRGIWGGGGEKKMVEEARWYSMRLEGCGDDVPRWRDNVTWHSWGLIPNEDGESFTVSLVG